MKTVKQVTQTDIDEQAMSAMNEAEEILENDESVKDLLETTSRKAKKHEGSVRKVLHEIKLLSQMVKAYWQEDYREVPKRTILAAAGGLLYFVSPIDLIPDLIPVFGYVDDVAVITFLIQAISDDLLDFENWITEENNS